VDERAIISAEVGRTVAQAFSKRSRQSTLRRRRDAVEFTVVIANEFISLQIFSNYNRLVSITAWILRFIRRCRGLRGECEAYGLTATENAEAERKLIQRAQAGTFAN